MAGAVDFGVDTAGGVGDKDVVAGDGPGADGERDRGDDDADDDGELRAAERPQTSTLLAFEHRPTFHGASRFAGSRSQSVDRAVATCKAWTGRSSTGRRAA